MSESDVFSLITKLCKVHSKDTEGSPRPDLVRKCRSRAYEILLHRGPEVTPNHVPESSPISELFSCYYIQKHNARSIAEKRAADKLLECAKKIKVDKLCERVADFENILYFFLALKNETSPVNYSKPFEPFTFGELDSFLPRLPPEQGSCLPYQYFPQHIFQIPFSFSQTHLGIEHKSSIYTEYTLESFKSQPYHKGQMKPDSSMVVRELKTFHLPTSMTSQLSRELSIYSNNIMTELPRLLALRDLLIPKEEIEVKKQDFSSNLEVEEMFRAKLTQEDIKLHEDRHSVDIWDLASSADKDVPLDVWEIAAKLPEVQDRRLIRSSPRETLLWRQIYSNKLSQMHIVSEEEFIRHIIFLAIGIESHSFKWSQEHGIFSMRSDLCLEGISKESIQGYVEGIINMGTCYKRLYNFAFQCSGLGEGHIYEAARDTVRQFLLSLRLEATEICTAGDERSRGQLICLPTLLKVLQHLEPLRYQVETVASIYKVIDTDGTSQLSRGPSLMSYLYSEMSLITHNSTGKTVFKCLYNLCGVYFKFIERFIFEGDLDDGQQEFFIRKEAQHAHSGCRLYWSRGFCIADAGSVPNFLRSLASHILLCGKSYRLLKLCNPNDPLVLISEDHPPVRCCSSFQQMERQRKLLDVYRTRCLFVSGEPVTFDQIMLGKEAERKAFTEMAAVKQAETLEKIVAERKRLAQLKIAEKQQNFHILVTAIAETEAAKKRNKRNSAGNKISKTNKITPDEIDAKTIDAENNKMMEYYSKLNQEVEKRKAHSEWKLKRLQFDTERMQYLSTEERNLKREKLELEHARNSDSCSNSFYSTDSVIANSEHHDEDLNDMLMEVDNNDKSSEITITTGTSGHNFFDSEGNAIHLSSHTNEDIENSNIASNSDFISTRMQAIKNKQKVLAHEFEQLDVENNITNVYNLVTSDNNVKFDQENNVNRKNTSQYDAGPFAESLRNKNKVLTITSDKEIIKPSNNDSNEHTFVSDAQAQAWSNRIKVMGTEEDKFKLLRKSHTLDSNEKTLTEAQLNRRRGDEGTLNETQNDFPKSKSTEYLTDAQKEALANKRKVLGTEYYLDVKSTTSREPLNIAQEEAMKNKKKILASEYGIEISSSANTDRRAALKLDLKRTDERVQEKMFLETTSTAGGITPGDFYSQLELETPTTADIPLVAPSANMSPSDQSNSILNLSQHLSQEIVSSEGFKFPSIILEEENPEVTVEEIVMSIDQSPTILDLHFNRHFEQIKSSILNLGEDTYDFGSFDPFGVKGATLDSKDHLSTQMNIAMKKSCYSNPADILLEAQKKPYTDIFGGYSNFDAPEVSFDNVNIATLTACFQRSVLLPLFYQLELVNNSILTYYLVNLDMYEHLHSLKNYFFLMDGEFSGTICKNLFQKLEKTINPEELLNYATLGGILDKALGSSITNVNKFSEKLSFTITDAPLSFQHSSPDVLQCLSLSYTVSWPMNIILSSEALAKYATCFQFLLKMRRISWTLGQDFEILKLSMKLSTESRALVNSPQYNSVQLYRHNMASLVRALDNYIVTTCIQTSWKEFENDLKKARTLDDLLECHQSYIKKVLFRCLLNKRSIPVMKLLNDVFTIILRFSHVLKTRPWVWSETFGHFVNPSFVQLQELFHLFEKLTQRLHRTVAKLLEVGYQPHLAELLTMINLNGYYDPVAKSPNTSLDVTQ